MIALQCATPIDISSSSESTLTMCLRTEMDTYSGKARAVGKYISRQSKKQ